MSAQDQGADATQGRWIVIPRTLSFVTFGDEVLLLRRAAHKRIFPNKYNGLGGHLERDEDPLHGALREIEEEAALEVKNARLRGVINIDAGADSGILLFIFTAEALTRQIGDCDEGTLEWVALNSVAEKDLVEDLPILLPLLFGENARQNVFFGHEFYDEADRMVLQIAEEPIPEHPPTHHQL